MQYQDLTSAQDELAWQLDNDEPHSGVFTVWTLIGVEERCVIAGVNQMQASTLILRLNAVYGDTQAWAEED